MKRFIDYKMANGETITAEVDGPELEGVEPVSLRDGLSPNKRK